MIAAETSPPSDRSGPRSGADSPAYTVALPALEPITASLETLLSFVSAAANPENLCLIGTGVALDRLLERVGGDAPSTIELSGPPDISDILSRIAREEDLGDLIYLQPGLLLPPLFDIRLQWSAYVSPQIGVVSPLCDTDPLMSIERHGIRGDDFAEIDRVISAATSLRLVDAPFILPECFYLRRDHFERIGDGGRITLDLGMLGTIFHRKGITIGLAPHLYVGRGRLPKRAHPALGTRLSEAFRDNSPVPEIARRYFEIRDRSVKPMAIETRTRPRVLLVTHSLGGGLERWNDLYEAGATDHDVLILKSIGERGRFGSQLWLYDSAYARRPIRTWKLSTPIADTAIHHLDYATAFQSILQELSIDGTIVSSLIGHSLDALRSDRSTVYVCHDYYPFCPALHIHFGEVCKNCGIDRLGRCLAQNPMFEVFDQDDPEHWRELRRAFVETVVRDPIRVRLAAPSRSVQSHYQQLIPELRDHPFSIVPHADAPELTALPAWSPREEHAPLRVLVPGRLSYAKGGNLLAGLLDKAGDFAEFFLLGCGDHWPRPADKRVTVVPQYKHEDLNGLLEEIQPDLALLLSIVPETFSFTLSECFVAGVPPVATRVGSFADRIREGTNGFLCEPTVNDVLGTLCTLHRQRTSLDEVRAYLRETRGRSAAEMTAEYTRLLNLPRHSERGYFGRASLASTTAAMVGWHAGRDSRVSLLPELPPSSPLGLLDFLRQVEEGLHHHLQQTRRLTNWQRRTALFAARTVFGAIRTVAKLI